MFAVQKVMGNKSAIKAKRLFEFVAAVELAGGRCHNICYKN